MIYSQSAGELRSDDGVLIACREDIVARLHGPDKRGKWYVFPAVPGPYAGASFPLSRYGETQASSAAGRFFLHCPTYEVGAYIAAHREDLEVIA